MKYKSKIHDELFKYNKLKSNILHLDTSPYLDNFLIGILDLYAVKLNTGVIYIGRHKLNIIEKKTIPRYSITYAQNDKSSRILSWRN